MRHPYPLLSRPAGWLNPKTALPNQFRMSTGEGGESKRKEFNWKQEKPQLPTLGWRFKTFNDAVLLDSCFFGDSQLKGTSALLPSGPRTKWINGQRVHFCYLPSPKQTSLFVLFIPLLPALFDWMFWESFESCSVSLVIYYIAM